MYLNLSTLYHDNKPFPVSVSVTWKRRDHAIINPFVSFDTGYCDKLLLVVQVTTELEDLMESIGPGENMH
jgi:hypothetical protein